MLLNVNPTRMELLRLKERLQLARRGHKLLKDKLEGLMKNFLDVSKRYIDLRKSFDEEFVLALKKFEISTQDIPEDVLDSLLEGGNFHLDISSKLVQVMNVKYPAFSTKVEGSPIAYPYSLTPVMLDYTFLEILKLIERMVELASLEQELYSIALEVAKVRRRVNALEYVLIPNLEETVKYIESKLEEMDRENIARLLKMKDIIRGH
ncbi:MAG: V-type ATP synthase subunit D [Caldisericum sp.]|jgi:V/A-type H+-transporting ATPase subunit D|nr:V-type ATP synthase subunit D [Caldisericum sp.]